MVLDLCVGFGVSDRMLYHLTTGKGSSENKEFKISSVISTSFKGTKLSN